MLWRYEFGELSGFYLWINIINPKEESKAAQQQVSNHSSESDDEEFLNHNRDTREFALFEGIISDGLFEGTNSNEFVCSLVTDKLGGECITSLEPINTKVLSSNDIFWLATSYVDFDDRKIYFYWIGENKEKINNLDLQHVKSHPNEDMNTLLGQLVADFMVLTPL